MSSSLYYIITVFICIHLTVSSPADKYDKEKKVKPNKHDVYQLLEHVKSPMTINCSDPCLMPNEEEKSEILAKLCEVPGGIGIYPRGHTCSFFIKENLEEAERTLKFLMDIEDFVDFIKTCMVLRSMVNEEIYVYAVTAAITFRSDTCSFQTPPIEEVLPQWFFPSDVLTEAKNRVQLLRLQNDQSPTRLSANSFTRNLGNLTEGCLAYFREDISFNSHHWNWHRLNPSVSNIRNNTKDRQGELFYYLHQQIIARYDAERFSCGLPMVIPYNLRGPIIEEYFPPLLSTMTMNDYPGRAANVTVQDVPSFSLYIDTILLWFARLNNSTSSGIFRRPNGTTQRFLDPTGINLLGSIIEPISDSMNRDFYGSYHAIGHVAIARAPNAQDPFGNLGVMGFTSTAVRDPVFYRWHKQIDDLFNQYKLTLTPYTAQELAFPSVAIVSLNMRAENATTANVVETFLQEREVDIRRGLDFDSNPVIVVVNWTCHYCTYFREGILDKITVGDLLESIRKWGDLYNLEITIRHLQHQRFTHNIEVNNRGTRAVNVTVRLFIAPKLDEKQTEIPLHVQRRLFIELDRFTAKVNPGRQVVTRASVDSSVTIPTQKGFNELAQNPAPPSNATQQIYCGCGWPEYLLLPRGTSQGMVFNYFAMLTDGAEFQEPSLTSNVCSTAPSYCGVLNSKYPDTRAMGYPFDRPIDARFLRLQDFVAARNNMKVTDLVIRHTAGVANKDGIITRNS